MCVRVYERDVDAVLRVLLTKLLSRTAYRHTTCLCTNTTIIVLCIIGCPRGLRNPWDDIILPYEYWKTFRKTKDRCTCSASPITSNYIRRRVVTVDFPVKHLMTDNRLRRISCRYRRYQGGLKSSSTGYVPRP